MSTGPTETHHQPNQSSAREEKPRLPKILWALGVVLGPLLIVGLFSNIGTTSVASGRVIRQSKRTASLLRLLAILGVILPWGYAYIMRPWHLRWGATDEEVVKPLLGDELVPDPVFESTRAITVHAPVEEVVEEVWSWLDLIGQDRGGLYSYGWLKELSGTPIHEAERSHPEWQHRVVGETIRLFPATTELKVMAFEPGRATVLEGWGTFAVEPIDEKSTRVILRSRALQGLSGLYYRLFYHPLVGEFPHFLIERRMLKGIKERIDRQGS
jgi:hypothetical protein